MAVATGVIAIEARAPAPAQLQAPPPIPASSPAPRPPRPILEERALTPFNAIRTVRELMPWGNLVAGGFSTWDGLTSARDYLRAIEKIELLCEGSRFTPRHIRRLQLRTWHMLLADAPGEIFKVPAPRGVTPRLEINFGTLANGIPMLLDAARLDSLTLCAELADRCRPERIRVFVTHWIGGR